MNGRYLDDPAFRPLWDVAVRLHLPVFTHPLHNAGEERMTGWHLPNSVGNPGETALCGARLIMAGVLDRFPDLEFVLAHGGGTLPFLAGRLDHAYEVRPEAKAAIPAPPSTYLRRLYFDTHYLQRRGAAVPDPDRRARAGHARDRLRVRHGRCRRDRASPKTRAGLERHRGDLRPERDALAW